MSTVVLDKLRLGTVLALAALPSANIIDFLELAAGEVAFLTTNRGIRPDL
jgi:hypothetical protein